MSSVTKQQVTPRDNDNDNISIVDDANAPPTPDGSTHNGYKMTLIASHDGMRVTGQFHSQHVLRRDIWIPELNALGFNVCNTRVAMSTVLAIAISAGGIVILLYGLLLVSIAYFAVALTLAELASVHPTAGGQYHFVSILSSARGRKEVASGEEMQSRQQEDEVSDHALKEQGARGSQWLAYVCGLAATTSWVVLVNAVQQTASRMTFAFARDRALTGHSWPSDVHPRWQVPVWSLVANAVIVFVIGCIWLGSMAALSAIIGSSLILQMLSFVMPAVLLIMHKRSVVVLPRDRPSRLPGVIGWAANLIVVISGIILGVFFCFPGAIPVTGSSMNYASAVLIAVGLFGGLNWFAYAKKRYAGPVLDFWSAGTGTKVV